MARIAIVTSHPPFAEGGHLVIANALKTELVKAGHDATVTLTAQNRFGRQGAAYVAKVCPPEAQKLYTAIWTDLQK